MDNKIELDRRSFMKLTALAGGGLMLGTVFDSNAQAADATTQPASSKFTPNAFVSITADNVITLVAKNPEIGQGVKTSLPMIIAEELDVPFEKVIVEQAPLGQQFGRQGAGGSTTIPGNYRQMRQLGATARMLLIGAAAKEWNVAVGECTTENGEVVHAGSNKRATYGSLAAIAATLPVPGENDVKLKDPKDFKLLGKRIGGVDNPKLVTGQALFGIDLFMPGMVFASLVRCPMAGGKIKSADVDAIKKLPGIKDAFVIEEGANGVAIIGNSTHAAFKAASSVAATWDRTESADHSSDKYKDNAENLLKSGTLRESKSVGDLSSAWSTADAKVVEATYHFPLLSHATLEPQNTTALFKDGKMTIWSPTQSPGGGRDQIARVLKLNNDDITVNITRSGGGFGRRLSTEYMVEAAAIAHKIPGVPVKLTWSREQDMQFDNYRPGGWHALKGAVKDGKIIGWHDRYVSFGTNNSERAGSGGEVNPNEFPSTFIPNFKMERAIIATNVNLGPWRAPGSNAIACVFQCFIDELAGAAGIDPVKFRLDLLASEQIIQQNPNQQGGNNRGGGRYNSERAAGVLKLAAEKTGWGRTLPKGQGMGIAFHFSHQGYVAVVAEVTVSKEGALKVNKLTAAVDVGPIINLSGAENQVQGSMMDGFSATLGQEILIENGRVKQTNFHDYPLLRMPDAPAVDVHFLASNNGPTGLGEPALPPTPPAICNAIFAATGKRVRSLPITKNDLSWS